MKRSIKIADKRIKDLLIFGRTFFRPVVPLLLLLMVVTTCPAVESPRTIGAGDQVSVDFTCRLKDSKIVMTTDKELAEDVNELKADIFIPLKEYKPVVIPAGQEKRGPDYGKLKTIENEILEILRLDLVGMRENSTKKFRLTSGTVTDLTKEERFLKLSRIRRQPKFIKVSPDTFKKSYKKEPVQGEIIASEDFRGLSMKVNSITNDEVQIKIIMEEGMKVDLPLGTGTVHDAGDHYETELDIHTGQIIRSGAIVGRVVDIEGDMFTIDYANPFGYESLECDVTAGKIIKSE